MSDWFETYRQASRDADARRVADAAEASARTQEEAAQATTDTAKATKATARFTAWAAAGSMLAAFAAVAGVWTQRYESALARKPAITLSCHQHSVTYDGSQWPVVALIWSEHGSYPIAGTAIGNSNDFTMCYMTSIGSAPIIDVRLFVQGELLYPMTGIPMTPLVNTIPTRIMERDGTVNFGIINASRFNLRIKFLRVEVRSIDEVEPHDALLALGDDSKDLETKPILPNNHAWPPPP